MIAFRAGCIGAVSADIFVAVGDVLFGVLAIFGGVRGFFVGIGIVRIGTTIVLAVVGVVLALGLFLFGLFAAGFASRWIFHTNTINTTALCWARDRKARIISTLAFFADTTARTLNARTRIADTLAFVVADLAGIAGNAFARIIDALAARSAALGRRTSFGIADIHALAFFAELVGRARDPFARVTDTFAVLTKLSVRTTKAIAVVFDAFSVFTSFTRRASDAEASIDTNPFLAFFIRRADDVVATVADVVATVLTAWAFAVATVSTTSPLDTGFS